MTNKGGRPANQLKKKYIERYELTGRKITAVRPALLQQLEACKNESARRLLMGVSR